MFYISRDNTRRMLGADRPAIDYQIANRCWSILEGDEPRAEDLNLLRSELFRPNPIMALYESVAARALYFMSARTEYFDLLWIELSGHADWRKRMHVAMKLGGLRRELAIEIAARFTNDRSTKVRTMAASKAIDLDARELLPVLQARLEVERDPATRRHLELAIEVVEAPLIVREKHHYKVARRSNVTFKWRRDGRYVGCSNRWQDGHAFPGFVED